jgi:hypothetical protein
MKYGIAICTGPLTDFEWSKCGYLGSERIGDLLELSPALVGGYLLEYLISINCDSSTSDLPYYPSAFEFLSLTQSVSLWMVMSNC